MNEEELIKNLNDKEKIEYIRKLPFSHDLFVLLPQCIRSDNCTATKKYGIIECKSCMTKRNDGKTCLAYELEQITKQTAENEKIQIKSFIITGRAVLNSIIREGKPRKVLGVACQKEAEDGIKAMNECEVEPIVEPLTTGGCSETNLNIESFKEKLINSIQKKKDILIKEKIN